MTMRNLWRRWEIYYIPEDLFRDTCNKMWGPVMLINPFCPNYKCRWFLHVNPPSWFPPIHHHACSSSLVDGNRKHPTKAPPICPVLWFLITPASTPTKATL